MAGIDVIIPVYNQARTLPRCLASVFRQSVQDFTVTVVDDGSTPSIDAALAPYLNRVHVIRQENRGAAAARNRGATAGSAPYVLFCDADVILKTQCLATQLTTLLTKPKISYVYSNFLWGWKKFQPGPFSPDRLQREPYINTHALLRREHFPGFDETLKRFQDWDLWLTLLELGHSGAWIDEVLFSVQPGGTMSRWLPKTAYHYLPWLPAVRAYHEAVRIIQVKHHIT